MLRRILDFFRGGRRSIAQALSHPDGKRIYREFHNLRKEQMDQDALKVINRLSRHGYRSYLVGGCVRDMVLGKKPKDFDVVTQATPSQVRRVFANSRTIGRRFKIVHVVFRGGKVVEVSTFRGLPEHRLQRRPNKKQDLLLRKDNVFGTPREDAARRDFSINALFFDPRNESIIDYVGGFEDVTNRVLRVIGDPDMSFSEDPVRMLRAAKFAAMLKFEIEAESAKAIRRRRDEIAKASPARMLEEYYKIFRTGKTFDVFRSFAETGLLQAMFPFTGKLDGNAFAESQTGRMLEIADKMLTEREDLTTVIYLAMILSELVPDVFSEDPGQNIAEYVKQSLSKEWQRLNIPGKERDRLMQIFVSQPRFLRTDKGRGNRPDVFRSKNFFYEAFLVFKIHAIARGDDDAVQRAMFWEFGPKVRPPDDNTFITFFPQRRRRPERRDDETDDSRERGDRSEGQGRDRDRDRDSRRRGRDRGRDRADRPDRPDRPPRDRDAQGPRPPQPTPVASEEAEGNVEIPAAERSEAPVREGGGRSRRRRRGRRRGGADRRPAEAGPAVDSGEVNGNVAEAPREPAGNSQFEDFAEPGLGYDTRSEDNLSR
jgi:poly(A) polymerase